MTSFAATCGYHRKAALRLLNRSLPTAPPKRAGPKINYEPAAVPPVLKAVWLASDQLCSKLLKAALPEWLEHQERRSAPLPEAFKEKLLAISPAQIDRLLRPARVQHPKKGLSATRPGSVEADTVTLSVVVGTNGPTGTYRSITIDGNFSDWVEVPWTYHGGANANPVNYADVQFANDANYLYGHFTLHTAAAPFSNFKTHLFIDTGNNGTTGYLPTGLTLGSELMIESGTGYDERGGVFNGGTVSGLNWLLSPSGAGTNFEARISRQAQYTGGAAVFTNSTIRFILQDNRGSVLIPQGVAYTFADGGPYENWRALSFTAAELANAAISGDGADPDADGIPNLVEYAFNLNPRVSFHPDLPRAFVQNVSGQDYLQVQYTQRNAPADVQYLLQTSPDLLSWNTNSASFTQVSASNNGNGTSLVTLRLQSPISNATHTFVRIAIQR